MLDHRIHTFLKLCELMNYRRTAEALNLTQPAVTQQIHHIEEEYGCKLFHYNGRALSKTPECCRLEPHLRGLLYNETKFRQTFGPAAPLKISIGATKTIGDYTIEQKIFELLRRDDIELELIIDNTDHLLSQLDAMELDLLLVEGFFDKERYDSRLIRRERLTGICSESHPFAGKTVPIDELFKEHLILREEGSGTRAVFEQFLYEHGYTTSSFRRKSAVSSFKLIEKAVSESCGISFVYESILQSNEKLAAFQIEGADILHEFNYVFLPNTSVSRILRLLGENV